MNKSELGASIFLIIMGIFLGWAGISLLKNGMPFLGIVLLAITAFALYFGIAFFSIQFKNREYNDEPQKGNNALAIIIIAVIVIIFLIVRSGVNDNKYDVVYDDNGFLGYSDSFWDWWGDQ